MVYAALIGAGVNAFQSIRARDEKKKLQRDGERLVQQQLGQESLFASQQRQALQAGIDAQDKGFANAGIATANIGRSAKRRTLDRQVEAQSRASQQLASSGLLNSSVQANLDQGISGATDRRLAEIDNGLAGIFSNLAVQRAGAKFQGQQALASFLGQRQARRAGIADTRFDLLNTQVDAPLVDVGGLAASFGVT